VGPSSINVYSGISNAMVTITKAEGFRSLWRGVSSVVVGAGPAHAVYFVTYESVKNAMGGHEGGSSQHHPLAAGIFHSKLCLFPNSHGFSCQRSLRNHCQRCSHEPL
jgi:hypothetical protein